MRDEKQNEVETYRHEALFSRLTASHNFRDLTELGKVPINAGLTHIPLTMNSYIRLSLLRWKSQLLVDKCERKRVMIMDNITPITSATPDAGPLAQPPTNNEPLTNEHTVEPLDELEAPNVRTKLRIYTILVALYVH